MSTTLDASAATFKIPLALFDLPPPVPRQSQIAPTSMRAMNTLIPRRRRMAVHLEPPTSGYREYMLFALRTRLTPELQELVGRAVLVSYTGYPAPSMRLSLAGGDREPHISASLRLELDALLAREASLPSHQRLECLLMRWNAVRYLTAPIHSTSVGTDGMYEKIPSRWLRSIMPFLPLDASLQADTDIPTVEYRDGALYADCLHTASSIGQEEGESYSNLFSRMVTRVMSLVRRWYDEGRIVDPEQSLVTRWKLEAVRTLGGMTMYRPCARDTGDCTGGNWGISRLSRGGILDLPVSALLYELAKGRERSVAVRVGINLVDYHAISKRLFGGSIGSLYHFAGGALHFIPRDLDDLLRVLDGVDEVLYGGEVSGAVVTLTASRLSWIRVYALVVQRSISSDVAIYVRRDVEPLFVISFGVPVDSNISALRQEIVLRARRLLIYISDRLGAPGSGTATDVHALLDSPETALPSDLSSPTVRSHFAGKPLPEAEGLEPIQF